VNKKRILIVDDEVGFTHLLRLNLSSTGKYSVQSENSALRALGAVRQFRPDLILLDVMMPDLDGGAVAAQLQGHSDTRNIPVVFVTAAVRKDEIAARDGRIGGDLFVSKPVELDTLVHRIDQILSLAPPPAGAIAAGSNPAR
jgi:CheY-like chemotaxis protein